MSIYLALNPHSPFKNQEAFVHETTPWWCSLESLLKFTLASIRFVGTIFSIIYRLLCIQSCVSFVLYQPVRRKFWKYQPLWFGKAQELTKMSPYAPSSRQFRQPPGFNFQPRSLLSSFKGVQSILVFWNVNWNRENPLFYEKLPLFLIHFVWIAVDEVRKWIFVKVLVHNLGCLN